MPCEQLFSSRKQVATDCWASLGPEVFEELVIMGSVWGPGLCDLAAWNATQVEEVGVFDFEQMLANDVDWD